MGYITYGYAAADLGYGMYKRRQITDLVAKKRQHYRQVIGATIRISIVMAAVEYLSVQFLESESKKILKTEKSDTDDIDEAAAQLFK